MDVTDAIRVARVSDVGLIRERNEDAVASDMSIGLVILADGMGGYRAGEVASEIAVLTIAAEISEAMNFEQQKDKVNASLIPEADLLIEAVKHANQQIYRISQKVPDCSGMGTTLVAGIFTDNKLVIGHIGDSRLYRLRGDQLTQLTEDHSLLQEQLNAGQISREEAEVAQHKNLVTRALGVDPQVELELQVQDVLVGDKYLLCSDGLTESISDAAIREILINADDKLIDAANQLVRAANDAGGKDNISVILTQVIKEYKSKKSWVKNLLGKTKKS